MMRVLLSAVVAAGVLLFIGVGGARAQSPENSSINQDKSLRRALSRLERGDIFLARPLFQRLFEDRHDLNDSHRLQIAEGLATCELARGEAPAAVKPWLEALRLRNAGIVAPENPRLPALVDEQWGLAPLLAPVWLAGPELASLVDESFKKRFLDPDTQQSPAIVVLARGYHLAALFELGIPSDIDLAAMPAGQIDANTSAGDERLIPAVDLVAMIVDARIGDAPARTAARMRIQHMLDTEMDAGGGAWREAWLRVGLGRSLLREDTQELRDQGIIELMHLPARFADSQPRLAAIALAEVSREFNRRGDLESAEDIAALLVGRLAFPDVLRWLRTPERSRQPINTLPDSSNSSEKETTGP